jgi:DNA uptake protein ComE-like DNA-binding protein
MVRTCSLVAVLIAGTLALAAPLAAQVQSQPLPPPAGTPPATSPAPSTAPAPATPSTKTEPAKTPTPLTKPAQPAAAAAKCPADKVDINAATAEELRKLPQIGVQRSHAIVKARPYATPDDLLKKKVLKKAVYDRMKTCVTASGVEAPVAPARRTAAKTPAVKPPTPPTPTTTDSQPTTKQ